MHGNLGQVYRETERQRLGRIKAAASRTLNKIVKGAKPLCMEILGEQSAAGWYLVYPYPGDDLRALRWLGRRRFGAFRPMQQRRHAKNEAVRLQGWEPMFPGWLFVRVFDIDKMLDRLTAVPGVMKILRDPATNDPVAIPDQFVDDVRALGWDYDDTAPHARAFVHHQRQRKRRRRPGRRLRTAIRELQHTLKAAEQAL